MTALPSFPQSWRRLVLLLPVVIVTIALITGYFNESFRPRLPKVSFSDPANSSPFHSECKSDNQTSHLESLPGIIQALWAPLVFPITGPTFTTLDGTEKHLPPADQLIHTQTFGKRICILDVDTRPLENPGSVFASELPTWDNLRPPSAGFLSHYLYALIHGYTYKFVRAPKYADRAPHWTKIIFTRELLKEFDIVVMLDYDAMFPSPELPIEWLLNYWKIDKEVMVAMAEDPDADNNKDLRGNLNLNTGFIIAQAGENTQRLFKDWAECPEETRYKGCAEWKDKIFHEQTGFSSYVRYDFLDGYSIDTHPQYIRKLPCMEANGIPLKKDAGCGGQFVRHYWGDKGATKNEFKEGVMDALTPLLLKSAFGDTNIVRDMREKTLKGAQVLDSPNAAPTEE
ncbi:hypothetical protein B0T22DRAFT_475916 [Podospora appendiculata]|uniref:Nucleotide-diphospho-sugar transferase domain-containing protein n=1 Tax=Podospora appendiculata TaxID=314037 RepID=A0AAE1CG83_9PEZI|nr:hypothetical protein B0T22DRAFT_475916 [Podospora appendiculata]